LSSTIAQSVMLFEDYHDFWSTADSSSTSQQ